MFINQYKVIIVKYSLCVRFFGFLLNGKYSSGVCFWTP